MITDNKKILIPMYHAWELRYFVILQKHEYVTIAYYKYLYRAYNMKLNFSFD